MPLTTDGMNLAGEALKAGMDAVQLHSADPGSDGVGFELQTRKATAWGSVVAGDFDLSSTISWTGLTANQAVTHVSVWSQVAAGGTCYAVLPLAGDNQANAAGEYNLTELTVNGTAT